MKKQKKKFKKKYRTYSPKKAQIVIRDANALAAPVCESEGIELVHLEYQRESAGWIMRMYIDKPGGVTLDDCANISRQMNDLLDVYLEEVGPYNLEVTSPGPRRPLSKLADYERFKGRLVKVKTLQPIKAQKNFTGIIAGLTAEKVTLLSKEKTVDIPFGEISKARLVDLDGEI